ncbi:MAG TPA: hypothetical protein VEZ72_24870 [Paenibacillus sp.]|nr:hypothetical protein [Paenibacillus sp.]
MKRKTKLMAGAIALVAAGGGTSLAVYAQTEMQPAKQTIVKVTKPDLHKEPIVINPSNADYSVSVNVVTEEAFGTGATKWIDTEVLPYVGERLGETKALLSQSYKLIDAYLIGSSEVEGSGEFMITPMAVENMLQNNYDSFKSLYTDELTRGAAVVEELKSNTDGPLPWNKHEDRALLQIVIQIDEAYRGAIGNPNRSNVDADTRFMKARDVFQRYHTWLFGGKFHVEGIEKDEPHIPKVEEGSRELD